MIARRIAVCALARVGALQMSGDLTGSLPLLAIGAATGASPAPRVFCTREGYEAFSAGFELAWIDEEGRAQSAAVGPEVYARMRGPYNRRNVYGAVLAGGPLLERHALGRDLAAAVNTYALRDGAALLRELGLTEGPVEDVRIRYFPREGSVPRGYEIEMGETVR